MSRNTLEKVLYDLSTSGANKKAFAADPDVQLWEAVLWAAASGTFVALARMLATRRAAHYYQRSTGQLPPELQSDAQRADMAKAPTA